MQVSAMRFRTLCHPSAHRALGARRCLAVWLGLLWVGLLGLGTPLQSRAQTLQPPAAAPISTPPAVPQPAAEPTVFWSLLVHDPKLNRPESYKKSLCQLLQLTMNSFSWIKSREVGCDEFQQDDWKQIDFAAKRRHVLATINLRPPACKGPSWNPSKFIVMFLVVGKDSPKDGQTRFDVVWSYGDNQQHFGGTLDCPGDCSAGMVDDLFVDDECYPVKRKAQYPPQIQKIVNELYGRITELNKHRPALPRDLSASAPPDAAPATPPSAPPAAAQALPASATPALALMLPPGRIPPQASGSPSPGGREPPAPPPHERESPPPATQGTATASPSATPAQRRPVSPLLRASFGALWGSAAAGLLGFGVIAGLQLLPQYKATPDGRITTLGDAGLTAMLLTLTPLTAAIAITPSYVRASRSNP